MAANEQGVQSASGMQSVTVNMVSDVVCPWCIVGYQRLQEAIKTLDNIEVDIKFHPFELNPNMPEEGQNLREHIMEKYGISEQQSAQNRARLVEAGEQLGFSFNFTDDSRMQNTFKAHQLIHFAAENGLEEEMKLALFNAYFTDGKNINDLGVLVALAQTVGLDKSEAEQATTQNSALSRSQTRKTLSGFEGTKICLVSFFGICCKFPPSPKMVFDDEIRPLVVPAAE